MQQIIKYLILSFLPIVIISSCSESEEIQTTDDLELQAKYKLDVLEPSGLAVDKTGSFLYTVSDNSNKIYKLNTTGSILKTYAYEGNDLEGVSVISPSVLLLAEERTKEIVVYDLAKNTTSKHKINYENNDANSGIEGVAYNSNDGTSFILNEKDPGLLMRLRSDFSIIATYNLSFASDFSGIFYENSENILWIVSDQNKTINKCTVSGQLIKSYSVNINKIEGIAIVNNKIYAVSDADDTLYVYNKPQ